MKDAMMMQRLLTSMFVVGLSLGVAGCDDDSKTPAKTAKKGDKATDAKKDDKAVDPKKDDKAADPAQDDKAADPAQDDTAEDPAEVKADAAPDVDAAPDEALEGYDPRVAKAAHVATKISEEPDNADQLLAAADLDRDKLDDLMYEIANDPDLTAQYRMARGI